MSLRIWLPLNGDLKNNGVNQYEITTINTISWVNGKIGKAVQIGNGNQVTNGISINSNLEDILAGNYSISVWIKPLGNHVHYNGAIISSGDWNNTSAHSKWSFGVSQDNTKVDVLCTGYNTYLNCACPVNEWTHLACVYNGTNVVKLYKNGEYVGQYQNNNFPTQRPTSSASNTTIGRETYANGYFSFNGCINDLRIYDHALSEKEVKKISQGLILHYPLNRNGFGQENLMKNSHTKLDNAGYYVGTYAFANPSELVTGEKYTFSFSGELQDPSQTGWYFNIFPSPYPHIGSISTTEDGRYSFTFTMPENGGNRTSIGCYSTPLGNYKGCAIWDVKLEKGEIVTPWCPNSADTIYTTLGLDDNIEYDMSGFGNNGTRFNTFDWDSNAPKYNISTIFNGNNNAIQTPDLTTMITDKNYTISCWFYKTVIGTKGYQTIYGGPFGFELEARNAAGTNPQIVAWNWGKPTATYEFNTWNHFAFVHSDSDCKIYLNGVLAGTGTAKASNPSGNYFVGSWSSSTSQNFDGLISDFRIYATALSQADIAELYSIHRS